MSHAKIGRFSKKQIFELPDGTHRLEPHLYVRVRGKSSKSQPRFDYGKIRLKSSLGALL